METKQQSDTQEGDNEREKEGGRRERLFGHRSPRYTGLVQNIQLLVKCVSSVNEVELIFTQPK